MQETHALEWQKTTLIYPDSTLFLPADPVNAVKERMCAILVGLEYFFTYLCPAAAISMAVSAFQGTDLDFRAGVCRYSYKFYIFGNYSVNYSVIYMGPPEGVTSVKRLTHSKFTQCLWCLTPASPSLECLEHDIHITNC